MSKLDLLLEAERRGILPDDKKVLLEEARSRGLVPKAGEVAYGSKEDIAREATRRTEAGIGPNLTDASVDSGLLLNAVPYVVGVGKGTGEYVRKRFQGEQNPPGWVDEYARERDIYKTQKDHALADAGSMGTVASVVSGFALGSPKTRATAPARTPGGRVEVTPPVGGEVMQPQRSALQDNLTAIKYGAGFSGVAGWNESTGTWEEKAMNAGRHAVMGAAMAPLVKGVIDSATPVVRSVDNALRANKQTRAENANRVAADLEATAGPGMTYGPAMAPGWQRGIADMIDGNVAAGPLQRGQREVIQAMEQNLQRELAGAAENATPSQAGERIRTFTREQMLGTQPETERVNAAVAAVNPRTNRRVTPEQLQAVEDLATIRPAGRPPTVPPVQPREIERVTPDAYLEQVRQSVPEVPPRPIADVDGTYMKPTLDEVKVEPTLAKAHLDAQTEVRTLENALKVEGNFIRRNDEPAIAFLRSKGLEIQPTDKGMYAVYTTGKQDFPAWLNHEGAIVQRGELIPPDALDGVRDVIKWLNRKPQYEKSIAEKQTALTLAKDKQTQAQMAMEQDQVQKLSALEVQRREEVIKERTERAQAEAALETQRQREAAVERERANLIPRAEEHNRRLEQQARAEAAQETTRLQQEANAEHNARSFLPFRPGQGTTTIHNQLDAAYDVNRMNAPSVQANILGGDRRVNNGTRTARLLDDIGMELRGANLLPGYKDGRPFAQDGRIQPNLMEYLRERLPPEMITVLENYSTKRALEQANPGINGLLQIQSRIRRMADELDRRARFPGETRSYDTALMRRFHREIDNDIRDFARMDQRRGAQFVAERDAIDAAYATYSRDRRLLRNLIDENADTAGIYNEVVGAIRNGSEHIDNLRRLYNLVDQKGNETLNRSSLTGMLLTDMTHEGLPGFMRSIRNVSDDAWALMFQGPTESLGARLRQFERAAGTMEPYIRQAQQNPNDLRAIMRLGNIMFGFTSWFHIPSAVGALAGTNAAARFLNSNYYRTWLRTYPMERGPTSPQLQQHMKRLVAYLSETTDLNDEAPKLMKELFGVKPAAALFVGERDGDKGSLKNAKEMLQSGAAPEKIWSATGWYRGKDGKWRSELSDEHSSITEEALKIFTSMRERRNFETTLPLHKVFKHDELFRVVPSAKNIQIKLVSGTSKSFIENRWGLSKNSWGGLYDGNNTIYINTDTHISKVDLRSSIVHEVSHWLGERYGFQHGNGRAYELRYGEIEARNTERRLDMNEADRRNSYPPSTQSIPFGMIDISGPRGAQPDKRSGAPLFLGEESGNKASLKEAKDLKTAGEKAEKIWADTGWYQGKDGKWRWEMDDKHSSLTSEAEEEFKISKRFGTGSKAIPLHRIMGHKELYKAVPDAKDLKVRFLAGPSLRDLNMEFGGGSVDWSGLFDEEKNIIYFNTEHIKDTKQLRGYMLHEISHWLDNKYKFDYGGFENPYERRQGEVQARNADRRKDYTEEERRKNFPPKTQDIPWPRITTDRARTAQQ